MWPLTCVPVNVYNALYKFKPVFRCVPACHFWVFCWVLIALILDNGKGTRKELGQYLPPKLRDWTMMRMVRSEQWDVDVVVSQMSREVLHWLPAPADGIMRLRGYPETHQQCHASIKQHSCGNGRQDVHMG